MKVAWRKVFPTQLANQLALLLTVAVLLSNLIAMFILQQTGALIHPLSRDLVIERITTAYVLASHVEDTAVAQALATMQSDNARYWLSLTPDVAPHPMREEELRLSKELSSRITPVPIEPVMVQLERHDGGMARTVSFGWVGREPLQLRTSLRLPDARYLNALQHPAEAYEWSRLLAYALPVSSLPLLFILLFFVRRVVKPIKTLAQATEQISQGHWQRPLPLQGPLEAQELTQAFNVMQQHLMYYIESRTRMFSALSHDLNTPVTEIRLLAELLEPGPLRDDILDSLAQLQAMISETINFIRDGSEQEMPEHISLNNLLDELARRYQTLQQPVSWFITESIYCQCRPLALKRALTNLIDNAIYHAGDAEVHAFLDKQHIRIVIRDHGPGIPVEQLEQVFEPFIQLGHGGARNRTIGAGLGLGLAIARTCIHAHGGELILENQSPAGLCAVVVLPQLNMD